MHHSSASRRRSVETLVLTLVCAAALSTPALSARPDGASEKPGRPAGPARRVAAEKDYEEFQVAAGTTLPIALRTRLSSAQAQRGDHLEGRLLRAIVAGDVELVPEGATVLGTVTDVERPVLKNPARLSFTFHVIEHPATGSRATIRAAVRTFQSERPPKSKVFPDVQLEKDTDASVLLLAPLVVRIPGSNPATASASTHTRSLRPAPGTTPSGGCRGSRCP